MCVCVCVCVRVCVYEGAVGHLREVALADVKLEHVPQPSLPQFGRAGIGLSKVIVQVSQLLWVTVVFLRRVGWGVGVEGER